MTYYHTHASKRDQSPAMLVSETETTITLMNECGDTWTDPKDQWADISDMTNVVCYICEGPTDEEGFCVADECFEDTPYDEHPPSQSGAEFMADYYNSDSYINYLNG